MNRITISNAMQALAISNQPFVELLEHGSLLVEIYKPDRIDKQGIHSRDEVYVVIAGHGFFVNGDSRGPFEPGEVLFIPAGVEHRFEDFSDDFSTWVIFYGPEGGEAES